MRDRWIGLWVDAGQQYPRRAGSFVPLLLWLLAGCSTTPPQGEATGERRGRFACSNGERVEMRFFPAQGVGVLVRNGKATELQQQPAGSGFLYSNGPDSVRGKGNDITIETGRMAPLVCKAA